MRLVLASASPRRAELLNAAGIEFDVVSAEVDELMDPEETPDGYVRRVALSKAEVVRAQTGDCPILAADTVVVVDNEVLGKPADADDARRMLTLLSGRQHAVITAVCLINPPGSTEAGHDVNGTGFGRVQVAVSRTTVEFAELSQQEIDWYVASGEPMDKAGAYGIQGLASRFVTRIMGSYSNVVGLPIALVYELCKGAGILIS